MPEGAGRYRGLKDDSFMNPSTAKRSQQPGAPPETSAAHTRRSLSDRGDHPVTAGY